MYNILYEFLILNKQLSLPGIGTIHLKRTSSVFDFGSKIFTAPAYVFTLENEDQHPSRKLFEWLSAVKKVSEWEAIKLVNDFSFTMKNIISDAGEASWENVGKFLRDEAGHIVLETAIREPECELPVEAEKIIREKAEHTMRVGESERTVIEMEELLTQSPVKKDAGWIIAIVITILSIMLLGIYFSQMGLDPSSAGNQHIIQTR